MKKDVWKTCAWCLLGALVLLVPASGEQTNWRAVVEQELRDAGEMDVVFAGLRQDFEQRRRAPRVKSARERALEVRLATVLDEAGRVASRIDSVRSDVAKTVAAEKTGIPVVDVANLAQNVIHLVQRYYEIAQKTLQIVYQLEELVMAVRNLESLGDDIPFTDYLDAAERIYNAGLGALALLPGEDFPGLVWSLPTDLRREFENTFPGDVALSFLPQLFQFEGGSVMVDGPRAMQQVQGERALRALRAVFNEIGDLEGPSIGSNVALGEMKAAMRGGKDGNVQAIEVMSAMLSVLSEEVSAGNLGQSMATSAMVAAEARELNAELQERASHRALFEGGIEAHREELGGVVILLSGEGGSNGLPRWVR